MSDHFHNYFWQINPCLLQTGEFDWSGDMRGVILSSFAYGYIATQLLGGYLAGRFGAKKTLFCGIVLSTACTLVGPLASIGSPYLLIATQVLNGFGQVSYNKIESVKRTMKIPY